MLSAKGLEEYVAMKKAGQGWGREKKPKTSGETERVGHSHRADVMWPRDPQIVSGDPTFARTRMRQPLLLLGPERKWAGRGQNGGGAAFRSRFQFTWNWWCEQTLERRGTRSGVCLLK